jgi:uncharacterized protein
VSAGAPVGHSGPPETWREYGDPRPPGYSRVREAVERAVRTSFVGDWPSRLYGLQCVRPGSLRLERHTARLRSLAPGPALRLAFLTDLHFGPTVPAWFLRCAVDLALSTEPDLILLGGDILMLDTRGYRDALAMLSLLDAPLGVFGVLGNHDIWVSRTLSARLHAEAGVELLTNRGVTLGTRLGPLYLCGVDDDWSGAPDAPAALADRPADVPALLLAHSPASLLSLGPEPPDLALCGHTHGGQICRPDGRPLWVPHAETVGLAKGWGRIAHTWAYVSRGLGCAEVPVRLWCPAEVTLLRLEGATRPSSGSGDPCCGSRG